MSQIQFNADGTINFGDYTLTFTDEGFEFDGAILATEFEEPIVFQGSVSGYTSGGFSDPQTYRNTIDKFAFATDGNATDVGDLTLARASVAGQSSTESGYTSGGSNPSQPTAAQNIIDKFPFAADGNATDVGDLTSVRQRFAGQSSAVSGYSSGGITPGSYNVIDKFPFSADANATDVGDLTQARYDLTGQSSTVSGYSSGGYANTTIDKFPFAADTNATDVGDLTVARRFTAGQSSAESGYNSGGDAPPFTAVNSIDKFPFATDANATDVGDLTQARMNTTGQSSTESGYSSGGKTTPSDSSMVNTIDKFPFAADANATDVGDLTQTRYDSAGQQV